MKGELRGKVVLVVDDDDCVRDAVAAVLSFLGCRTAVADSVAAARLALETGRYDAIVSDLAMPGESGIDLMVWLRNAADGSIRGIPAIAVSAYCNERQRIEALAAGFAGLVPKPFEIEELGGALAAALP